MWWWGPDWGWPGALIGALFWIGIIVLVVFLLRGELPRLQDRLGGSPALRLLEERYAKGEISREEFLERRAVLAQPPVPPPDKQSTKETQGPEPTEQLPPPSG
jgi:putative membrane protein